MSALSSGAASRLLVVVGVSVSLAACGSSGNGGGASTGTKTAAKSADSPGAIVASYTGVDRKLPKAFPGVTKKPGNLTFGYLQIDGAVPVLKAEENGARAELASLGAKMIVKDAVLDPQQQATEFEQLVAQGVNGIMVYPVIPQALAPQLAKAKAAGIPVVSKGSQADATAKLPPGYATDVEQSFDEQAYAVSKAIAAQKPGASFVTIGLAIPVAALNYLNVRLKYWGEKLGLKFLGNVDAKADSAQAYADAMTAVLGTYPNVDAVETFNDQTALSASTIARSQGKSNVMVTGAAGGINAAVQAIKSGSMFATASPPWAEMGKEMAVAAYSLATKQNLPLLPRVSPDVTLVTKANADTFQPVDK